MSYIYTTEEDKQLIHYELSRLPLEIIHMILIKFKGLIHPHCIALNITKCIINRRYSRANIKHLSEDEITELMSNPFKGMGDLDSHMRLRDQRANLYGWHGRKWHYQCRWRDGLWGDWRRYKDDNVGLRENGGGLHGCCSREVYIDSHRLNRIVWDMKYNRRDDMRELLDENGVEWKKSWNKKRLIKALRSY